MTQFEILAKMKVVFPKPIKLHSGEFSCVKYDIDNLEDSDLRWLTNRLPKFNADFMLSVGGGKRFAYFVAISQNIQLSEMWEYYDEPNSIVLLVDDVVTSGESLRSLAKKTNAKPIGLVIVKRGYPDITFPLISIFNVDTDLIDLKVKVEQ